MTAGAYSFGEDRGRESERLDAVEQAFDAPSRAALANLITGPPVVIALPRR
jgi:hypothetical protein